MRAAKTVFLILLIYRRAKSGKKSHDDFYDTGHSADFQTDFLDCAFILGLATDHIGPTGD